MTKTAIAPTAPPGHGTGFLVSDGEVVPAGSVAAIAEDLRKLTSSALYAEMRRLLVRAPGMLSLRAELVLCPRARLRLELAVISFFANIISFNNISGGPGVTMETSRQACLLLTYIYT
jgi:hypothetical protein